MNYSITMLLYFMPHISLLRICISCLNLPLHTSSTAFTTNFILWGISYWHNLKLQTILLIVNIILLIIHIIVIVIRLWRWSRWSRLFSSCWCWFFNVFLVISLVFLLILVIISIIISRISCRGGGRSLVVIISDGNFFNIRRWSRFLLLGDVHLFMLICILLILILFIFKCNGGCISTTNFKTTSSICWLCYSWRLWIDLMMLIFIIRLDVDVDY